MNTKPSPTLSIGLVAILGLLFVLSLGYLTYGNIRVGSEPWQLVVSAILLSVPLALLYFSIGLIVVAWQQKRSQGQINPRLAKFIYRTPRIAGILIILFVGMFSLDVFSMNASFWEMVGGFIMHSLPAICMAILLLLAWRRPWIGCIAFAAASIYFLRFMIFNPLEQAGMLLLFSGPLAVIAVLFWANWKWKQYL